MYSKEQIELSIRSAVKAVVDIEIQDNKLNLVAKEMGINPAMFLYIFEILENELQMQVCDVFIDQTSEVMTLENLTNAIFQLQRKN